MTSIAPPPPRASVGGTLSDLVALLTRRRGDKTWSGIVRGTGIVSIAGIFTTIAVPVTAPLVGFLVVTIWVNGPIGMFLPATYEPILMAFGRVHPPLLIGVLGIVGTLYVEYLNFRLYQAMLQSNPLQGLSNGRTVRRITTLFNRAPFFTVWLCSWSPLPYWSVRILSPLAGYPVQRHLLATFLGRFPRLWFFAALGLYWQVDLRLVFGLSGVAMLAAIAVAWRGRQVVRRTGGQGGIAVEAVGR